MIFRRSHGGSFCKYIQLKLNRNSFLDKGIPCLQDTWEIKIGEVLDLIHEPNNEHDKNAIAVIKDNDVAGHVPWTLASTKQGTGIIRHFLTKKGSKGQVQVVGFQAVNRGGGYGMEIPCVYKFTGQPRNVDMLNKLLDIPNNRLVRKEKERDLKRRAMEEGNRNKKAK